MIESFSSRIKHVLQSHRFCSGEDLEQTILGYVRLYHGQLPQSVPSGRTPIDALEDWLRIPDHSVSGSGDIRSAIPTHPVTGSRRR